MSYLTSIVWYGPGYGIGHLFIMDTDDKCTDYLRRQYELPNFSCWVRYRTSCCYTNDECTDYL